LCAQTQLTRVRSNMKNMIQRLSQWAAHNLFHHDSMAAYIEPVVQWFKPSWRSHAWRAKVVSCNNVATNVIELTLRVSKSWPIHQAGQHVQLTVEMEGRLVSRVFSVSSSVKQAQQRIIRLTIRQYSQGSFTPRLGEVIEAGDWLNISEPQGEFTLPQTSVQGSLQGMAPLIMVAGGSGITPFMAILDSHLSQLKQPVSLLYYAKAGEHLFSEALMKLADSNPHFNCRLLVRSTDGDVTEQPEFTGANLIDPVPFVMMCGPAALVDKTEQALDASEHPMGLRAKEHFRGVSGPVTDDTNDKPITIKLLLNGLKQRLNLTQNNPQNNTLLTQLEQQGVAVPYGCRMGVCHQCQCMKRTGIVRDIRSGQLSAPGEQLIRLCVSQPLSELELEL
jgi:ferredoxin-NADP reductase